MPSAKSTSKTAKSKSTKSSDRSVDKKIASEQMTNDNVSPAKKIEELYSLVEGIDIAMLTSRNFDGTLSLAADVHAGEASARRFLVRHQHGNTQGR